MNLNANPTPFRRRSGAALLAVAALLGSFAFLAPVTGAGGSVTSRDAVSRGTDAVHPPAHTTGTHAAKRNSEQTADGSHRAEGAEPGAAFGVVGRCHHDHRPHSAGSGITARGPPTSPTA